MLLLLPSSYACSLLSSAGPSSFSASGSRRSALQMRALPPDVVAAYEQRFGVLGEPPPALPKGQVVPIVQEREVVTLWQALVRAYGSQELALQAVQANPAVVNPLYTTGPELVRTSKQALIDVMGSEAAAIEVMLLNPAVLQCGDGLRLQPAGQIRSFASFRAAVDRVPPAVSRGLLVGFVGVGSLNFVFVRSDDPVVQQLAATVKPVLGAVCASLFLAAIFLATTAGETASESTRRRNES
jgi:hypothetical protein